MKKYNMIKERVGEVDLPDSLVECLSSIQGYIDQYGDTAYFERDYYGYDGGYYLILWRYREETEKERETRLKKAKAEREKKKSAKEAKEAKERELFEQLKEKYG